MKTRLLFVPLLLALVASLAACGGGTNVPSDSVALVNGDTIKTALFNGFLAQALAVTKQNTGTEPTPGTAQYTALRDQMVAYLVRFTLMKQQADKEGISVSDDDVTKFLENLAQTNFGGSMKDLTAALKSQGLDMDTARQEVFYNLIGTKLEEKVTKDVTVTEKEIRDYYDLNRAQYNPPATRTREVEHILVKSKALADKIEQRLRNGASFAAMAKKYSQDPQSAAVGGKYTAIGQEVPAYDRAAFSLGTGILSAPIDATDAANRGYGWFIIKALKPVKTTPGHKTPFSEAKATIQETLLKQKRDEMFGKWVTDLVDKYKGKVSYQAGYAPPTTTALSTSSVPATTTTG